MKHLPEDVLLAYIRGQQLHLWTPAMREHLNQCPFCKSRCVEFKEVGNLLEEWGKPSSAMDFYYAPVSKRVMQAVYKYKLSEESARRSAFIFTRTRRIQLISIALLIVLTCTLLFAGITVSVMSMMTSKPKEVVPTALPRQFASPIPTATVAPDATPTVLATPSPQVVIAPTEQGGQQNSQPLVVETCTTVIDAVQNQLHVCGKHFSSDTSVTIYYYVKNALIQKHSTQVGADGTFNDMVYIKRCDEVPTAIYVQDSSSTQEVAQITRNIVFGTCQSFGGIKKKK